MSWYLIYFFCAIPVVMLSFVDLFNHGFNFRNQKTYILLFVALGAALNLIYSPIDHIESEKSLNMLHEKNILHEKNYRALNKENEALRTSNDLLKDQLDLLTLSFNLYRKQLMKFTIEIETEFQTLSNEDISDQATIPAIGGTIYAAGFDLRNNNKAHFQTQDNSYRYTRLNWNSAGSTYNFKVRSEVIEGKFPIGLPISTLKDISVFRVYIPVFKNFYQNNPLLRRVNIIRSSVKFTINGKMISSKLQTNNIQSHIGDEHSYAQDSWIIVDIPVKKSLYYDLRLQSF